MAPWWTGDGLISGGPKRSRRPPAACEKFHHAGEAKKHLVKNRLKPATGVHWRQGQEKKEAKKRSKKAPLLFEKTLLKFYLQTATLPPGQSRAERNQRPMTGHEKDQSTRPVNNKQKVVVCLHRYRWLHGAKSQRPKRMQPAFIKAEEVCSPTVANQGPLPGASPRNGRGPSTEGKRKQKHRHKAGRITSYRQR